MRKEKMNIRKRVKETLALALSLLMVLSVICVPIHLDAAPSIPVDTVYVEGEEISFTDNDFYLLEYIGLLYYIMDHYLKLVILGLSLIQILEVY